MKTYARPATTFVTVVLAVSALFGASAASVPSIAAKHLLGGVAVHRTAGRRHVL